MSIQKEIPELLQHGVISQDAADKIIAYYKMKSLQSPNRLVLVFALLGAILTGLGIVLMIAHNWDDLSRPFKIVLAMLPVITGQACCGYALFRRQESIVWKESSAAVLFFAIGAAIALVAQIFHIHGDLASFIQTWMWLCLPLLYIMPSGIASLLYLAGITLFSVVTEGAFSSYYETNDFYIYLLMFVLALPSYLLRYKRNPVSNFTLFHHWLIPVSFSIALITIPGEIEEWLIPAFMSLFGIFLIIGSILNTGTERVLRNGYTFLGSHGTIVLLLFLSFDEYWEELQTADLHFLHTPECFAFIIITLTAIGLFIYSNFKNRNFSAKTLEYVFLIFLFVFSIGISSTGVIVLVNLLVLGLGIRIIWNGAAADHLGVLNYGLLVISALVICRFFDTDLSFVLRGILFIAVGLGFFLANFLMVQKRKAHVEK